MHRPNRRRATRDYRKLSRAEEKHAEEKATSSATKPTPRLWPTGGEKLPGRAPLEEAVRRSLKELRGSYALVFLSAERPSEDCCGAPPARLGDWPWRWEYFVASDIPALLQHSAKFFPGGWRHRRSHCKRCACDGSRRPPCRTALSPCRLDPNHGEKGGYKHFMQRKFLSSRALYATPCSPHRAGHAKSLPG